MTRKYVYRQQPSKAGSQCRTYEIGECDSPRTHKEEWCDRRVCEGFWGDEEKCAEIVNRMNES